MRLVKACDQLQRVVGLCQVRGVECKLLLLFSVALLFLISGIHAPCVHAVIAKRLTHSAFVIALDANEPFVSQVSRGREPAQPERARAGGLKEQCRQTRASATASSAQATSARRTSHRNPLHQHDHDSEAEAQELTKSLTSSVVAPSTSSHRNDPSSTLSSRTPNCYLTPPLPHACHGSVWGLGRGCPDLDPGNASLAFMKRCDSAANEGNVLV